MQLKAYLLDGTVLESNIVEVAEEAFNTFSDFLSDHLNDPKFVLSVEQGDKVYHIRNNEISYVEVTR